MSVFRQLGICMPLCHRAKKAAGRRPSCIGMFYFYARVSSPCRALRSSLTQPTPNDAGGSVIGFASKKHK
jgi:hypothetical protein